MTITRRILILPVLAIGAVLIAVFYIIPDIEGEKKEWGILQKQINSPIVDLELHEEAGYHLVCLPSAGNHQRIWIMLDPQYPSFYKQIPHDMNYSLSREQLDKITATQHVTPTVEEVFLSHMQ